MLCSIPILPGVCESSFKTKFCIYDVQILCSCFHFVCCMFKSIYIEKIAVMNFAQWEEVGTKL